MLMESQEKFQCLQNISGPSQHNSVAVFSFTTEVDGHLTINLSLIN